MSAVFAGLLLSAIALAPAPAASDTKPPAPVAMAPADSSAAPSAMASPVDGTVVLPALTPIELETVDLVSSGVQKPGDLFKLRVASPVMMGNAVLIPVGTPAIGQVVHSAKRGMSGKAGELIVVARFVELPDRQIKLKATISGVGKNKQDTAAAVTIAASAAVPVASFIGLMIRGKDMVLPAGTRVLARTAAAIDLGMPPAETMDVPQVAAPIDTATSPIPLPSTVTPEPTEKDQPAP